MYSFYTFNMHTLKKIETFSFATKKEANKKIRETIKDNDMERHSGHIVNYSTGLEIHKHY